MRLPRRLAARRGGGARRSSRRAPLAPLHLRRRRRGRLRRRLPRPRALIAAAASRRFPADQRSCVTFGVAEPFMTSIRSSSRSASRSRCPIVLWQMWSFLAPAFQPHFSVRSPAASRSRRVLFVGGVVFGYTRCASGRVEVPDELRPVDLQHPDPSEGLHVVLGAGARRGRRRVRAAGCRARARPARRHSARRRCAATAGSATSSWPRSRWPCRASIR